MTTTIMRNSQVGDEWIRTISAANPAAVLPKAKPTDPRLIQTGPCRLAFPNLWEPKVPNNSDNANPKPKYSVTGLYTPYTDKNVFYGEWYARAAETFQDHFNPQTQQYYGLDNPFHDGADKAMKFEGYTSGLMYMNHSSDYKPTLVTSQPDGKGGYVPVTRPEQIYPGVWAILVLNTYVYGKSPPRPKKGVGFGLSAVMIIGDDTNLSGGAIDSGKAFAGVKVAPPSINVGALAGIVPPPPPGAPSAGGGMPPLGVTPGYQFAPPVGASSPFVPPPPPAPMAYGMGGTVPADDDRSSIGL